MRICFVISQEKRTLFAASHYDPSCLHLALYFKDKGNDVEILLTDSDDPTVDAAWHGWTQRGLKVTSLHREVLLEEPFHPQILRNSWLTYQWLKTKAFDRIIFQDNSSAGLLSFEAKKLRESFGRTSLIYCLHGPAEWSFHRNDSRQLLKSDPVLHYSVQYAVEHADQLIIPASYFLERARSRGWHPTETVAVLPYLREAAPPLHRLHGSGSNWRLLYAVHHSDYSALSTFVETLDALGTKENEISVSMLCYGGAKELRSVSKRLKSLLGARGQNISFDFVDGDRPFPYLEAKLLWLFSPFWLDLPCPLLNARDSGQPLLVADTGESRTIPGLTACLVDWNVAALTQRLRRCLAGTDLPQPIGISCEEGENLWNQQVLAPSIADPELPEVPNEEMGVTVCIAHFNNADYLTEALESFQTQTLPPLEVIVIDDASTDLASRKVFGMLSEKYKSPQWKFIQQEKNLGPGFCRNVAAALATSPLLLFFDADDMAFPEMIERMVRALRQPKVDCVAASSRRLTQINGRWEMKGTSTYVGGSLEAAFLHPPAGSVVLISKKIFDAVGGFEIHDWQDCYEDWNFNLRLLALEYRLHVLPEPVFAYRLTPQSRTQFVRRHMINSMAPLLHATPQMQKKLLLFAVERASGFDRAMSLLAEYDSLAGGIRALRRLERLRKNIRKWLPWRRQEL